MVERASPTVDVTPSLRELITSEGKGEVEPPADDEDSLRAELIAPVDKLEVAPPEIDETCPRTEVSALVVFTSPEAEDVSLRIELTIIVGERVTEGSENVGVDSLREDVTVPIGNSGVPEPFTAETSPVRTKLSVLVASLELER